MDEFELIETFFARPVRHTEVGIGDDAAIIRATPGCEQYVAVDTLVGGRHFPDSSPPESIGHRALAVNVSDLTAMGATARWATLALTVPQIDQRWLSGFATGFNRLAAELDVELIGGDTTEGPLTITVTVLGEAPAGLRILRSGAKVGDDIFISGALGDAAAGLDVLLGSSIADESSARYLTDRFLWPKPRTDLIAPLREFASAAIDVSDGLLADLGHVTKASNVGAVVSLECLPLSLEIRQRHALETAERLALSGGDDYEILFTAPLAARAELAKHDVTRIGTVVAQEGLHLLRDNKPVALPDTLGYRHLKEQEKT